MMVKRISSKLTTTLFLGSLALFLSFLCYSNSVFADSEVDNINIIVPVSCSIASSGMTSHYATINNGQYNSNIGETNIKVFCNDTGGFALYAIGYTDNTDGKNVLTNGVNNTFDIATGTGLSGSSQWAMKLATVTSPAPSYPVIIAGSSSDTEKEVGDPDFSGFSLVPDEYSKVAYRNSRTDTGANAEGSTLKTTYQVFISDAQPTGAYAGQVKYTLVHPSDGLPPLNENEVAVNYNGNGLTFADSSIENTVVYSNTCTPMYAPTTPIVEETSNLNNGVKANNDSAYSDSENVHYSNSFSGASKVKVVVDYGVTGGTSDLLVINEAWDGNFENYDVDWDDDWFYSDEDMTGTKTYILDGDTVTIFAESWDTPIAGYDYGYYIRIYPLYTTEQTGMEENPVCSISSTPTSGIYAEPTGWNNKWFMIINGQTTWFESQSDVVNYLNDNSTVLLGTMVNVYAYNPYTITYNGNNATAGTMSGFYTTLTTSTSDSTADLMAYNFKKTNYGFAGWSENQNATVNSSDRIYGPNEMISADELSFNMSTRQATLYAVWVQTSGTMQNWSECSSLSSGQVVALTDNRDNNVYTVGKMQDGNCWMMENLRLDAAYSGDSTKSQGFGGAFSGLANSEDSNFNASTTSNSKYNTSNITGVNIEKRFPRYNNNNTNIGGTNASGVTLIVTPGQKDGSVDEFLDDGSTNEQWYGYGNYYTWAAAMANTNNIGTISGSDTANTSICPAGWFLPYGGDTGSGASSGGFSYLDIQMGGTGSDQYDNNEIASNRWRSYPNNFVYSGSYKFNYTSNRGKNGAYWSHNSNSNGYTINIIHFGYDYIQGFTGASTSVPYSGFAVRCLTH